MTAQITEAVSRLSEEAQNAGRAKAIELNLNLDSGVVSLTESFTNLNLARSTLVDAIAQQKLSMLPLSIQREIGDNLSKIATLLTSLAAGTDEIVNLTNAIELLHANIWRSGLQNVSAEFLGYHAKLNQLKILEVETQRIRDELRDAAKLRNEISEAASQATTIKSELDSLLSESSRVRAVLEEEQKKVVSTAQDASASLTEIRENQKTSLEQAKVASSSAAEAKAVEGTIKEFFREIDEFRRKITETTKDAQTTISKNNDDAVKLVHNLDTLENQIKEQIERATGHSLFHSFQKRKDEIAASKGYWVKLLFLLLIASGALTIYIANSTTVVQTAAFYIKLSASIPLAVAITFCVVQYSRERRLEEEYAFKSNISISLNPYQELVSKLIDTAAPGEKEKFTAFLIESVNKVFTSPTDRIFDSGSVSDAKNFDKTLKQVTSMVKTVAKSLK